jgi:hypothetical protein
MALKLATENKRTDGSELFCCVIRTWNFRKCNDMLLLGKLDSLSFDSEGL